MPRPDGPSGTAEHPARTAPSGTAARPARTAPSGTAAHPARTAPSGTAAHPARTAPSGTAAHPARTARRRFQRRNPGHRNSWARILDALDTLLRNRPAALTDPRG
ncbi:hypothetical protein AB0K68_07065 [Streptomyces sp. NPDC050698]